MMHLDILKFIPTVIPAFHWIAKYQITSFHILFHFCLFVMGHSEHGLSNSTWTILKSNHYFTIEKLRTAPRSLSLQSFSNSVLQLIEKVSFERGEEEVFRIQIKGPSKNALLLTAYNYHEINECWDWIERNMLPVMDQYMKTLADSVIKRCRGNDAASIIWEERAESADGATCNDLNLQCYSNYESEFLNIQQIMKTYFVNEYKPSSKHLSEQSLLYYQSLLEKIVQNDLVRIEDINDETVIFFSAHAKYSVCGNGLTEKCISIDDTIASTKNETIIGSVQRTLSYNSLCNALSCKKWIAGSVCLTKNGLYLVSDSSSAHVKLNIFEIENVALRKDTDFCLSDFICCVSNDSCICEIKVGSKTKFLFDLVLERCNASLHQLNILHHEEKVTSESFQCGKGGGGGGGYNANFVHNANSVGDNTGLNLKENSTLSTPVASTGIMRIIAHKSRNKREPVEMEKILKERFRIFDEKETIRWSGEDCTTLGEPSLFTVCNGTIFVTENFVCFQSVNEKIMYSIPMNEIISIDSKVKEHFLFGKKNEISIKTCYGKLFVVRINGIQKELSDCLQDLWNRCKKSKDKMIDFNSNVDIVAGENQNVFLSDLKCKCDEMISKLNGKYGEKVSNQELLDNLQTDMAITKKTCSLLVNNTLQQNNSEVKKTTANDHGNIIGSAKHNTEKIDNATCTLEQESEETFGLLKIVTPKNFPVRFVNMGIKDRIILKTPELFESIKFNGIHNSLRPLMWPLLAGVYNGRKVTGKVEFYEMSLVCTTSNSKQFEEIERDLRRSLPNQHAYQNKEGIDALRRVLQVFTNNHASIGYTQGMNIIAAILLLYLPENIAYDTLTCLIVHILPEQYSKTLVGSVVDQRIFEQLLKDTFPNAYHKFISNSIQLNMLTISWFVCLFTSALPRLEDSCLFFDCFFWEGPLLVFKFALAIFESNINEIMQSRDEDELIQVIKEYFQSERYSFFQLIQLATSQKYSSIINHSTISKLRKIIRISTMQEIERTQRKVEIKKYGDRFPLLSKQEIETIYKTIQRIFLINGKDDFQGFLIFKEFYEILRYILPEWCITSGHSNLLVLTIFEYYYQINNSPVDYFVIFEVVQILRKGRLRDKLMFLYNIHTRNNSKDSFDREKFTKNMARYLNVNNNAKLCESIKRVKSFDQFTEMMISFDEIMRLLQDK